MKERKFGLAKGLLAVSMLGIVASVIMFQGIGVPTVHLQRFEWSRWFLFVSWILYFFSMVGASGIAMMGYMPEKRATAPAPAPAVEGEEAPAPIVMPAKESSGLSWLYGSLICFLLGTLSMIVYFAFVTLPSLPKSITGL